MGPLDTLWHLLNFLAPALGMATFASLMARGLWRRRLRQARLLSLIAWSTGGASVALAAGLALFGRDGRVASYALMVVGAALCLGWAGFKRRSTTRLP